MNKVSLISTSAVNLGIRSVSSYLKQNGYETKMFFLDCPKKEKYNVQTLSDLEGLCQDISIIGISGVQASRQKTLQILEFFKNKTTIVGGYDSTISPKYYINANYICRGDGEKVMLNLMKGFDLNRKILPLKTIEDINELPLEDYGPENHFVINEEGRIDSFANFPEYENPRGDTKDSLFYIATRGCCFNCSYCQEPFYQKIINSEKKLRMKSVDKIIGDLKKLKKDYSRINQIYFLDPDFFVKNNSWLNEFVERYPKEIKIPFWVFANPFSVNSGKIELLHKAGLDKVQMGIQSGSERTNRELYSRKFSEKKILENVKEFQNLGIEVWLDVIYDNPWENKEDIGKTIDLIEKIPQPFKLGTFALSFFEGTPLYKKAIKEKINVLRSDEYVNFHKRNNLQEDLLNKKIREKGMK